VTGCLLPTPADNLPFLEGIQPAELRRNGATLPLAHRIMEPGHLLHSAPTCPPSANAWHLKSRHIYVSAAQQLVSSCDNNNNIRAAHWADHRWNAAWAEELKEMAQTNKSVKSLCSCSEICVRVGGVKSQLFTAGVGLRQGRVLSPLLSSLVLLASSEQVPMGDHQQPVWVFPDLVIILGPSRIWSSSWAPVTTVPGYDVLFYLPSLEP